MGTETRQAVQVTGSQIWREGVVPTNPRRQTKETPFGNGMERGLVVGTHAKH